MMYMPKWKKILIVIVGLWEILLFSGTILGWTSLKLMLKREGIYDYKCKSLNETLSSQNLNQLSKASSNVDQTTPALANLSTRHSPLIDSYTLKINFTFTNGDQMPKQINDSRLSQTRNNSVKRTIVIPFHSQQTFNRSFIYTLLADSPVLLNTNSSQEQVSLFNDIDNSADQSNLTVLEKFVHLYMEENLEAPHSANSDEDRCKDQELTLNLAFSIGSFCMGAASFIWGFLLERWGLRVVRLIINSMISFGAFLLCFTTKGQDWLLFPAILIMSLGGVPIRIVNMQFSNLYPSRRSTIIAVYSGAFSASSIIYVVIQYIYAHTEISFFSANLILVLLSLLMIPFTLFILPPDKVSEPSAKKPQQLDKNHNVKDKPAKDLFPDKSTIFAVSKITLQNYKDVSSPNAARKNGFINQGYLPDHDQEYFKQIASKTELNDSNNGRPPPMPTPTIPQDPPLSISLKSFPYNLHQLWFSWMITYMLMNVGSMNLWAKRVTDDRIHQAQFISFFGLFQVTALLISPLAGILMDWKLNQANKELDPLEKQVKRVQSGFWSLFITNLTLLTCVLCHYFDSAESIYISIVFVTIYRAFLLAVGSAFLRVRFHGSHFNRLLGIMSSVSAVTSLLQIPFFEWESSSQSNVLYVNIVNTIIVFIVMLNPVYLLFTPLQRYFVRKENEQLRKLR